MRERARITVPDVIFVLMSIGFLAVLFPLLRDIMATHAGEISTGAAWLYIMILPMALLVLFSQIFRKASEGMV